MSDQKRLRMQDITLIDDLFDMGGGYVLDFTNRTFSEFFRDELGVNIDAPRWHAEGTSKAKRLRYFLRQSPPEVVVRALKALWEYRESSRRRREVEEPFPEGKIELFQLIERLGGTPPEDLSTATRQQESTELNASVAQELLDQLTSLHSKSPQQRGYAFERFLNRLFHENGLGPRASFRLTGEQIDGSFEAQGETYLLEAKWEAQPIGVTDLRSFNAKVEDKAAWSRGLFVSDSGFSDDGLEAFGKGKSVICMDGLDLSEMLQRRIHLAEVLRRKVRRAAETGRPFVRVRDLF